MNPCLCRLHHETRMAKWLLFDLRSSGFEVWSCGERFLVAPRAQLGEAMRAALRRHRDAVHAELRAERRN